MEEWDCGNEDFGNMVYEELNTEGFDCASVDMLLGMARDGEIDTVGDVFDILATRGRPNWAAEISRILMGTTGAPSASREPDYASVASVLTYMVDTGKLESASKIGKFLLIMRANNGADCYDLAHVLGYMAKQRKAAQGSQILFSLYSDESPEGVAYVSLVPFVLGTLVDNNHVEWVADIAKHLCYADGTDQSIDYSVMGWILGQHVVYFNRPTWAAIICNELSAQNLQWYDQTAMLDAIGAQTGDFSVPQVVANCMHQLPPASRSSAK